MEALPVVLSTLAVLAVVLWLSVQAGRRRPALAGPYPPGPRGLPFLGFLPFLGPKPHQTLFRLRDNYGPVVSVQLGSKAVVVLNSLAVMREALAKSALSGRPSPMPLQIQDETLGFVSLSGPDWKEQRQFSLRVLQSLGFGTIRMEDYVKDEIFFLLQRLKENAGGVTDLFQALMPAVGNIINALTLGRRLDFQDPKRLTLNEVSRASPRCFRQVAGVYFLPKAVQVVFKALSGVYAEARKYLKLQEAIVEEEIREHASAPEGSHPRDFIDKYLLEMNNPNNSKYKSFSKDNLMGNIRLLMGAGSDTILATLQWFFVAMAAYPEVQDRIQEELDSVIGGHRTPAYSDQVLLPYTQAVILEIHRWRTNLPLNVLRRTTSDCSVAGFHLPADTVILANLWAAHNDPGLWDSPGDFRPDRFLTSQGQVDAEKADMLATFSFGPRACPGKALAHLEIFLFVSYVLQRFRVSAPEGETLTLEGDLEISYKPLQQRLVFAQR